MYSLESPHRGDSNEYTQHTIILQKMEKTFLNYFHLPSDLALWLTLSGSNYPCLEQISMVPKMFELVKFDCILPSWKLNLRLLFLQADAQLTAQWSPPPFSDAKSPRKTLARNIQTVNLRKLEQPGYRQIKLSMCCSSYRWLNWLENKQMMWTQN